MTPILCAHPSLTANLFVQLSMGANRAATPAAVTILDLLLPPQAVRSRALHLASGSQIRSARRLFIKTSSPAKRTHPQWRVSIAPSIQHSRHAPVQARAFSASAQRNATVAALNPQKDEDGNDMILEITPRAAKRLSEIMAKDSNPNLALRIQVESGGCHGFQYLMSLVTLPLEGTQTGKKDENDNNNNNNNNNNNKNAIREDDTIFVFSEDPSDTSAADLSRPKIILDAPSLELLKGSKVDFTMELIGSQFKIVDNPLATSSCGCGTSFDIKM